MAKEFIIYELTECREEVKQVSSQKLWDWVDRLTYEKEIEIKQFSTKAKLGESIMSDFKYGYVIATRVR